MDSHEITIKINRINKLLDNLQKVYIDKTIADIKLLPAENQKNYWYKINLLNEYIDESFDFTQELINEVNARKTASEIKFYKDHIKVLKEYIKVLGGNPSNCNFA
jgi:hypothetical protein